ncbi:hypothetical protein ACLB2K_016318 [Fragaria x ananassa]
MASSQSTQDMGSAPPMEQVLEMLAKVNNRMDGLDTIQQSVTEQGMATQQSIADLTEQLRQDRALWKANQDKLTTLSEDYGQLAGEFIETKGLVEASLQQIRTDLDQNSKAVKWNAESLSHTCATLDEQTCRLDGHDTKLRDQQNALFFGNKNSLDKLDKFKEKQDRLNLRLLEVEDWVGMVFFKFERYALPPNTTCNAADIPESSKNVCVMSPLCSSEMSLVLAEPANAPPLEATSCVTRIPTLTFSTPTLDMATHMRPLYITAEVEGIMVNKVMVDTRVAVNVVTTRTMRLLGIPRSMIQTTSLTVKNFTEQVSRTLGLLFLRVKVGPKSRVYTFFVAECSSSYIMILGHDWIHRSFCVPSSMHQELMVWYTETCEDVLMKADPRPFSIYAKFNDSRYYNTDLGLLDVQGVNSKGRPYGVTASNLKR